MDLSGCERLSVRRTKGGRYLSQLTKEDLLELRHMSVQEAADKIGVGSTSFKLRCREVGITRWPFRQIKAAVAQVARQKLQEQQQVRDYTIARIHCMVSQNRSSAMSDPFDESNASAHSNVVEDQPEAAAAIKSMLDRFITPPQAPPLPEDAQADAVRYLAERNRIGEQATMQALFDQYGSSLAAMPPQLAAMLGMCGVDPSAVVRCVQEFAIRTIVNVLQDTEQRRAIIANATTARAEVR